MGWLANWNKNENKFFGGKYLKIYFFYLKKKLPEEHDIKQFKKNRYRRTIAWTRVLCNDRRMQCTCISEYMINEIKTFFATHQTQRNDNASGIRCNNRARLHAYIKNIHSSLKVLFKLKIMIKKVIVLDIGPSLSKWVLIAFYQSHTVVKGVFNGREKFEELHT